MCLKNSVTDFVWIESVYDKTTKKMYHLHIQCDRFMTVLL